MLVVIFGEIGVGKSTIATALAAKYNYRLIQFDPLVYSVTGKRNMYGTDGQFLLTDEEIEQVHAVMRDKVKTLLQSGEKVIVESMYFKKQREAVIALAEEMKVPFYLVEVICDEREVIGRIQDRLKKNNQSAGVELFLENKGALKDEARQHLTLDTTSKSIEDCIQEIARIICKD